MPSLESMLRPEWPAPLGVRAACSTRTGGVSRGSYASLNLGDHVGDDADAVAENRRRWHAALSARPVFLRQLHGVDVRRVGAESADDETADGSFTSEAHTACTVMVADCLPVLLCDAKGHQVAAAHAGWRGLAAGVLENALATFNGGPVLAWLGPCIGPDAFEVGDEVMAAFEANDAGALRCFRPGAHEGKWLADLPALARRRLAAAGVDRVFGNDGGAAWCTVGNPSRFFSHRRDGVSGRIAASIWRA
ncbi:MAG: peptidoglycan editing factor PgeF [Comamonadaceae bacterium]|nr:MAG: peptidoglycan editing factor PgeF [Comamonadaceae bacterium]